MAATLEACGGSLLEAGCGCAGADWLPPAVGNAVTPLDAVVEGDKTGAEACPKIADGGAASFCELFAEPAPACTNGTSSHAGHLW